MGFSHRNLSGTFHHLKPYVQVAGMNTAIPEGGAKDCRRSRIQLPGNASVLVLVRIVCSERIPAEGLPREFHNRMPA
jgi:hypothetical protein